MSRLRCWAGLGCWLLFGVVPSAEPLAAEFFDLRLGSAALRVSLADSSSERSVGLAGVEYVAANEGLLMVFDAPERVRLWMKGVSMGLDAGFFARDGTLVEVVEMWPDGGERIYQASRKVLYVLEVNQGWFAHQGISPGERLGIPAPEPLSLPLSLRPLWVPESPGGAGSLP